METADTRELVERYYTALSTGDRDTVLGCLDPDVVWEPPGTATVGKMTGAEDVARALGSRVIKETFDISKPFGLEIRKMIVEGDTAVVQQRLTATAKATGNDYDNQYCWVYTCADGRITYMEEYADTLYAARQMGWDLHA